MFVRPTLTEGEANMILEVAKECAAVDPNLAPNGYRVGANMTVAYWKSIVGKIEEAISRELCVK